MARQMGRRGFVVATLAGGVLAGALPASSYRRVAGAGGKLNIGAIGVGGRGAGDLEGVASENIVALCDVDSGALGAAGARHPGARKYADYRQLLEQKDLEAVVIGTPDHHHAPATARALRRSLHVYCEKPLTHTVEEARLITRLAAGKKLATQMGTQNHEHPGYIRLVELIQSGAIGPVREVHVITDRPGRWWPQGMARPTMAQKVPAHLDWDLWLGPAAQRDYHSAYVPFKWRGWWDFGCGAIGDMAIHLMDPVFWALDLGVPSGPVKVTSEAPPAHPFSAPKWMHTVLEFGVRGKLPPVKVHWYEGETGAPADIARDLPMNGSLFVGDAGRIAIQHDLMPRLLPEEKFKDFKGPEAYLPKSPGHHRQWIEACKTGSRTGSNFGYAGPFTELVLLGNIAHRVGATIDYNPDTGTVTNRADANRYLGKEYRQGWEVV